MRQKTTEAGKLLFEKGKVKNMKKLDKTKAEIRKLKKYAWFKPLGCLLLVIIILFLILGSTAIAKISAKRMTSATFNQKMDKTASGTEFIYEYDDGISALFALIGNLTDEELGALAEILGMSMEELLELINSGDIESLFTILKNLTDEELRALAEILEISMEELLNLINSYNTNTGNQAAVMLKSLYNTENSENVNNSENIENNSFYQGDAGTLEQMEKNILNSVLSKIENNYSETVDGATGATGAAGERGATGATGAAGKRGATGAAGAAGKDGVAGTDGEDGADGKTTYIAYCDDLSGTGFSLTPTETSKYIGTCITDESTQPWEFSAYSNWQNYRTYVITTSTDENGVTTIHIN